MDALNETAKNSDMNVNVRKTKAMVVSWEEGRMITITTHGKEVKQVKHLDILELTDNTK
jgi:hypothetical protein